MNSHTEAEKGVARPVSLFSGEAQFLTRTVMIAEIRVSPGHDTAQTGLSGRITLSPCGRGTCVRRLQPVVEPAVAPHRWLTLPA